MDPGGPNPGMCCRCDLWVTHRALIAIIETGSGPGGSAYACLPCARDYAKTPLAPDWLPEAIEHAASVRTAWRSRRGGAGDADDERDEPDDGGGPGDVSGISGTSGTSGISGAGEGPEPGGAREGDHGRERGGGPGPGPTGGAASTSC